MKGNYDDILHLPHPVSSKHPPMSQKERAAQFSAFAALTGHDAILRETRRLTQPFIELTDSRKEEINALLGALAREDSPMVEITHFVPDERKRGGAYVTAVGRIRRVDGVRRGILMEDGSWIEIDCVTDIRRGE